MRGRWMQDGIAVPVYSARRRLAALHLGATIPRLHWRRPEAQVGYVGVNSRSCEITGRMFRVQMRNCEHRRRVLAVTETTPSVARSSARANDC